MTFNAALREPLCMIALISVKSGVFMRTPLVVVLDTFTAQGISQRSPNDLSYRCKVQRPCDHGR
jgi:hypothetical protein